MENIWVDPKHIQDDHMAVLDKTVKDTISPFSERYDFEAELMSLFKQDDVAKRVLKMVADQSDAARKIRESIEITGFDFDTKQMPKMVELDQEETRLRWIGDHDRAEIVREQKNQLKEWMSNG